MEASRDILFLDSDLQRPRWVVEQEKVNKKFTGFSFYASDDKITSVAGTLYTSYENSYFVRISIPKNYPHEIPSVSLPYHTLESNCPHKYTSENICLMKVEQWTSVFSVAFVITKVAIWLNKYDFWKRNGFWPGNEQRH